MTSVLPENERGAGTMKPKSGNRKISIDRCNSGNVRDETRSFLDFSRENLSISHSELEQGFNKPSRCFRVSRQTALSVVAITVALVCAGIEIWKLHRVVTNAREIEILKRDVENLRHRMFGKDFMDELKAFEEQFYADETDDGDEDSGESDIEGADYDNNYYEDYGSNWSIDENVASESTTSASNGSGITGSQSKVTEPKIATSSASHDRKLADVLAVRRKLETETSREFDKNYHESRKNIPKEHLLDGTRDHEARKRRKDFRHEVTTQDDHPKRRRAVIDETPVKYSVDGATYSRESAVDTDDGVFKNTDKMKNLTTEATTWDRHPPKKYFAVADSNDSHRVPNGRHTSRRRSNSRNQRNEFRTFSQNSEVSGKSLQPGEIIRRHPRASRQVFAAHYEADSGLFTADDEHTGNGRAKHNEGVFRAWRPSDWVADFGMTSHFTLSRDGRLNAHEPGLYLVYAQIHYLDEHDENGFHVLLNNHPIMQCMVYSPGIGHKSRSCFTAQLTVLGAGDRLKLKDVGSARYTLFQHDKSFFGLVKLGDSGQR